MGAGASLRAAAAPYEYCVPAGELLTSFVCAWDCPDVLLCCS
jgi:hypothetical protein